MLTKDFPEPSEKDRKRFFSKLKADGECLIFQGSRFGAGHGCFRLKGKIRPAHQVAFFLSGGVTTEEAPYVLHSCDQPACCRPSHLRAGTVADNVADRESRGRGRKSRYGLPYGVHVHSGRFRAMIFFAGKFIHLGYFETAEEGSAVAYAERKRLRGW